MLTKPWAAVVVLGCALAMAGGIPAQAQNLIRNGSFEGPTAGNVPESWAFTDFTGGDLASGIVTTGALVGRECLKLQAPSFPADFAAFCRPIDVSGLQGREIVFSCFFRTTDHPQAQATLSVYDRDFTERQFRTPELLSESHPLGETKDWDRYSAHLTVPDGAQDLVVVLRVMGAGEVYYDGISVREVGAEVEVGLQDAGTVVDLPRARRVSCTVRNVTDRELPVRLEVTATDENGRVRRGNQQCQLDPGQTRPLAVEYPVDFRSPHRLDVAVVGSEPDEVYEAWRREAPGLVDAHIIEPAFRSTVLSTVPTEQIVVQGQLNASPAIARQAHLSARLIGTGAVASDPELLTEQGMAGPWRLTLPAEGMLSEQYQVDVTAAVGRNEQTLSLPLARAHHADAEVAYDAAQRLYVNGNMVFPIGMYRVVNESDLPDVAEGGCNFVITPSRSVSYRYVNAATDNGLEVGIYSPALDGLFWQNMVEKFIGHPGLLGWCGIQLPDTQSVTSQVLSETYVKSESGPYKALAELDAHHPVLLAVRPNSTMAEFAETADIVLVWTEPVPRWPLTTVADAVQAARNAVGHRKPVWAVIQSTGYGWSEGNDGPPPADSRPPTPAEHRAMTYLALTAGANGLACHAWSLPSRGEWPSYRLRSDAPDLWDSIVQTNCELNSLAPVLLASDPEPITLPFEAPIRLARWTYEGSRYVVAVNAADTTTAVGFDIGAGPSEEVGVLFENRVLVAAPNGEVGDFFDPYAVHVYQLTE